MKKQLIIDGTEDFVRVCVLEDGELVETLASSRNRQSICGSVYLGRVLNVMPGLSAAFVDIGTDKNAILTEPEDIHEKPVRPGDEIVVQVTKVPGGEKGATLSRNVKLAGRFSVLMPFSGGASVSKKIDDEKEYARLKQIAYEIKPEGAGIILRTSASGESRQTIREDATRLLGEWNDLTRRALHRKAPCLLRDESDLIYRAARDIFSEEFEEVVFSSEMLYNNFCGFVSAFAPGLLQRVKLVKTENLLALYRIVSQLEKLGQRKIWLKCGGCIVIDRTEAMTVIDVNSAKAVAVKDAESNILKVNMEAADEIVKQMRLRDVGGIIVADFINMKDKTHKNLLLEHLKETAKRDRNRLNVVDITPLGLVEMTRKRKNETVTY